MKKWIAITAAFIAGAALVTTASAATGALRFQAVSVPFNWAIGDKTYRSDNPYSDGNVSLPTSLNYEGTTYVPIRLLAETLGYDVQWDGDSKTAKLVASGSPEDPVADIQDEGGHSAAARDLAEVATLTAASGFRASPDSPESGTIEAGTKVKVMEEASGSTLRVAYNGNEVYIPAAVTDYVPEAKRPAWERKADAILKRGLEFLGTPYQFGAEAGQTKTFDCSSFAQYLFGKQSIKLPRDSRQQSQKGTQIELSELRKGDLIFFTTPQRKDKSGVERIGHVAIYAGNNKLLHTYRVGIGVTVTELDKVWSSRIVSAKRIIE